MNETLKARAADMDVSVTRRKRQLIAALVLAVVLAGLLVAAHRPIATHARALLLLSEEFPQVPVKPLALLSVSPHHRIVRFGSSSAPVIADLYLPRQLLGSSSPHSRPGIILALGVRVGPSAGQDIRHFADALSRLGYVVLWPRSSSLQSGSAMLEEPRTFVAAFRWLARQPAIDRHRVSYLGLSAGASEAFVAATDRRIARRVRALISIGAYYDLPAYLVSLATGRIRVGHREVVWNPARSLVAELTTILRRSHRTRVLQVFSARTEPDAIRRLARAGPRAERALRRLSPAVHVRAFHAPIFILHDRGDPVVPWVESLKLEHALPRKLVRDVYLSSVLQHVVPGRARWQSLPGEYWGLYSFMCDALAYL